MTITKVARPKGRSRGVLSEHRDCYVEVCRLEKENASLRQQVAALRAAAITQGVLELEDVGGVEVDW